MAGRGGVEGISTRAWGRPPPRAHTRPGGLTGDGMQAVFGIPMDKAWVAIHRALSDGTLYGTLGEPPLDMAVLGDHLICQTDVDDFLYLKHSAEVADIAEALRELTDEEFKDKL